MLNMVKAAARRFGFDIVRYHEPPPGLIAETGRISTVSLDNTVVRFFVLNPNDHIQRCHQAGNFYENEELAIIKRYFKGGTYVDVGANVGNHLVYVGLFLAASRLIAFEPNPAAALILRTNVALNALIDRTTIFQVGLSDAVGRADIAEPINNLGGARVAASADGSIQLEMGDSLLAGENVGFIKIDVEGSEMRALTGLKKTIQQSRPPMFVEVETNNAEEFLALMTELEYRVAERFKRYESNENFLVMPK